MNTPLRVQKCLILYIIHFLHTFKRLEVSDKLLEVETSLSRPRGLPLHNPVVLACMLRQPHESCSQLHPAHAAPATPPPSQTPSVGIALMLSWKRSPDKVQGTEAAKSSNFQRVHAISLLVLACTLSKPHESCSQLHAPLRQHHCLPGHHRLDVVVDESAEMTS